MATRRQGPHSFERRCILAMASADDHTTVNKPDDVGTASQIPDILKMIRTSIREEFREIAAENRDAGQRSTAAMISAFENMTRMLASTFSEAMALMRPGEQWGATIRLDHGQVLQRTQNNVECLQPVCKAEKEGKDSTTGLTGVYSSDVGECTASGCQCNVSCGKGDGVTAEHLPNLSKSECVVAGPASVFDWNNEVDDLCVPNEAEFLEVGYHVTSARTNTYKSIKTGKRIRVVVRKCLGVLQCPKCLSVARPMVSILYGPNDESESGVRHGRRNRRGYVPSASALLEYTCPVRSCIRGG